MEDNISQQIQALLPDENELVSKYTPSWTAGMIIVPVLANAFDR